MDLELTGKVAFITGAGQGIGKEIAQILASEGAHVAVNDLFSERADAVVHKIKEAGGRAMSAPADLTNRAQVISVLEKVVADFGPVDILVNNAGVPYELRTGEMSASDFAGSEPVHWEKMINLNLYGCFNCVHSVLNSMIERKSGKIISIISEAGRIGEANLAVYSGAKAGILGFTKAIARENGKNSINANCIAIGATAHEGTKPTLDPEATPETDDILKRILKVYPIGKGLKRIGRPSDAAYAVAFLASPKSEFVTGQCLSVSGGFSMVS